MRRAAFIGLVLLLALAGGSLAATPPPAELLKIMPDGISDLSEIAKQESEYYPSTNHYFYRRFFMKPGSKQLGEQVPLADVGYTAIVHIYYELGKPPVAQSGAKGRIEEGLKKFGEAISFSDVDGYPVGYVRSKAGYANGRDIMDTCKGKFYISIWVHYRGVDREGALPYARTALSYILSRISTGAPSPTPAIPVVEERLPVRSPAEVAREKKKAEDEAELARMREKWEYLAKKIEQKYSEEYKKEQEEKQRVREEQVEGWRQKREEQQDFESMAALLTGAAPIEKAEKLVCGGVEFNYYPEVLRKRAKSGESCSAGRWGKDSFVGPETYKRPLVYMNKYYVPVAYLSGGEITGYLWMDQGGQIVTEERVNRALFAYLYVFGFAPYQKMEQEIAEFLEDARKNDEEIASYTYYKDTAKTLKLASSAMSVYLSAISGGTLGVAVSAGLTGVDAGLFLAKMNQLESQAAAPDLSTYENYLDKVNKLDNLKTLAEGAAAARSLQKLRTELQTLKDLEKIRATSAAMEAAKVTMLQAAASLGWAVFDAKEGTGQIAEQAAVLSMKYTELKLCNLAIAGIIKEAQAGIADERMTRNILLLPQLKAKRFRLKGDLAATLLESYRERKSSPSGYLGRFTLYVQGRSVDEGAAQQAIYDLEYLVDSELNKLYEVKINTDVAAALASQRAAL